MARSIRPKPLMLICTTRISFYEDSKNLSLPVNTSLFSLAIQPPTAKQFLSLPLCYHALISKTPLSRKSARCGITVTN
ncbi:hypothetical protein QW060_09165 [Myroides ceti]|uniref:Uncharacterized protein n=1 Tax=Paenimyroides ceti TaxID=395087 RepID=A0ABT8CW84_9FLAO|nr:hypothetical protein [Paenimyroides ceti]MDN3707304.1 hypothetical protein [Paenimyroides ceti]